MVQQQLRRLQRQGGRPHTAALVTVQGLRGTGLQQQQQQSIWRQGARLPHQRRGRGGRGVQQQYWRRLRRLSACPRTQCRRLWQVVRERHAAAAALAAASHISSSDGGNRGEGAGGGGGVCDH
jgi:hypothetical protein